MSKDNKDEKNSLNKLEELLLKSRTIMLYGEINQKVAREFCTKLQLLASESDDDRPTDRHTDTQTPPPPAGGATRAPR